MPEEERLTCNPPCHAFGIGCACSSKPVTEPQPEPTPERCGSRGPRIGEEVAYCERYEGHEFGPHRWEGHTWPVAPEFEAFKRRALQNPEVAVAYEESLAREVVQDDGEVLAGLDQWRTGPGRNILVVQEHQLLDWLARRDAQRDAEVAATALEQAANEVEDECIGSTEKCFCGSADWLRDRAVRLRATGND